MDQLPRGSMRPRAARIRTAPAARTHARETNSLHREATDWRSADCVRRGTPARTRSRQPRRGRPDRSRKSQAIAARRMSGAATSRTPGRQEEPKQRARIGRQVSIRSIQQEQWTKRCAPKMARTPEYWPPVHEFFIDIPSKRFELGAVADFTSLTSSIRNQALLLSSRRGPALAPSRRVKLKAILFDIDGTLVDSNDIMPTAGSRRSHISASTSSGTSSASRSGKAAICSFPICLTRARCASSARR